MGEKPRVATAPGSLHPPESLRPPGSLRPPDTGATLDGSVRTQRVVGTALDALVRTVRLGDPSAVGLGRQLHAHWKTLEGVAAVEIRPTCLVVQDIEALRAEAEVGRWVLPAFMAGLRSLRLRPEGTSDDVLRLAVELGAVRAHLPSITAFRDWLWCDGASGFDVSLSQSFVELADSFVVDASYQDLLATRSTAAIGDWNRLAQIAAKELDAAAVRDEFRVPIDLFAERAAAPEFRLADVESAALRDASDDASAWSETEMRAVLALPRLRTAMPPHRLAQRIVSMIESAERLGGQFLGFLAGIAQDRDEYALALANRLEGVAFGMAIAKKLELGTCNVSTLRSFLDAAEPSTVQGVLHGLLGRGLGDAPALAYALALVGTWGWPKGLTLLDPQRVEHAVASVVCRAALEGRTPIARIAAFLEALPSRAAAGALAELPELRQALPAAVSRLLEHNPAACARLVEALLREGRNAARTIGGALLASLGEGWPAGMLQDVLAALRDQGLAREYVVPLFRARKARTNVRLAALRAVEADAAILRDAVRWGVGEITEAKEVKQRVRELRVRTKADE